MLDCAFQPYKEARNENINSKNFIYIIQVPIGSAVGSWHPWSGWSADRTPVNGSLFCEPVLCLFLHLMYEAGSWHRLRGNGRTVGLNLLFYTFPFCLWVTSTLLLPPPLWHTFLWLDCARECITIHPAFFTGGLWCQGCVQARLRAAIPKRQWYWQLVIPIWTTVSHKKNCIKLFKIFLDRPPMLISIIIITITITNYAPSRLQILKHDSSFVKLKCQKWFFVTYNV